MKKLYYFMLNIILILLIYLTGFNYPIFNIISIIILFGFNYYIIRKMLNNPNKQPKQLSDLAISLLCVVYFGYRLIILSVYNIQLIGIKSVMVDCKDVSLINTINPAIFNNSESYINSYIKTIKRGYYCKIPIKNVYSLDSTYLQIITLNQGQGDSVLITKKKIDTLILNKTSLYVK